MTVSPIDPNAAPGAVPGAVPGVAQGVAPMARPSVLSLAIKEKAALYAAYMPFLKHGGMFVPRPPSAA